MSKKHICGSCKLEATKVCVSPGCKHFPFFCGDCKSIIKPTQLHQDHGNTQIITTKQYEFALNNSRQTKYLDSIESKIKQLTKNFQKLLLDKYEQHKYDIQYQIELDVEDNLSLLQQLQKIQTAEKENKLTGEMLNKFIKREQNIQAKKDELRGKDRAFNKIKGEFQIFIQQFKKSVKNLKEVKFQSFKKRREGADKLRKQGQIHDQKKQTQKALQKYQQAIKFNEFDFLSHFKIAWYHHEKNDLKKARQSYLLAHNIYPEHLQTVFNIGVTNSQQGLTKQAIEWKTKAIQIKKPQLSSQCYASRAEDYIVSKDFQKALQDIKQAKKIEKIKKQNQSKKKTQNKNKVQNKKQIQDSDSEPESELLKTYKEQIKQLKQKITQQKKEKQKKQQNGKQKKQPETQKKQLKETQKKQPETQKKQPNQNQKKQSKETSKTQKKQQEKK